MALATGDDCRMPSHPSYILSRHVGDLGRGECVKQILLQLFGEPQPTAGGIDRPLLGRHRTQFRRKEEFQSWNGGYEINLPVSNKEDVRPLQVPRRRAYDSDRILPKDYAEETQ